MSGCRIGKIKLKGGAVLHRLPPPRQPDEGRDNLIRAAIKTADTWEDGNMSGYFIFAWGFDGTYNVAYYWHKDTIIGQTMLPSFVADAIRRELIENGHWER